MHGCEIFLKRATSDELVALQLDAEERGPLYVEALQDQFTRLGITV